MKNLSQVHIEFFDKNHFDTNYKRVKINGTLGNFIDFIWETDFNKVFVHHPDGFSDALFPNIGYTYLINLGTPFKLALNGAEFNMKSDGFLPRTTPMICHHSMGNKIYGIKFKISPILLEKDVDFSEYTSFIFPLAYLIDPDVIANIKRANNFEDRVQIVKDYYEEIIERHGHSSEAISAVSWVLAKWESASNFSQTIEELAEEYGIKNSVLRKYFEVTTGTSTKQAYQTIRIRKAIDHLLNTSHTFDFRKYGYFNKAHFFKHLSEFIGCSPFETNIDFFKSYLSEKN